MTQEVNRMASKRSIKQEKDRAAKQAARAVQAAVLANLAAVRQATAA
jgi:hypothetical protein